MQSPSTTHRAALHAALGDPVRLAIVESLMSSDRSPHELQAQMALTSNLLAHHLDVLASVGLVVRGHSSGDGRRRYVHLVSDALDDLAPRGTIDRQPALFICTRNSARSQLAAALWTSIVGEPAVSAGTHPAQKVHPGAVAAAKRAGLDLSTASPRSLEDVDSQSMLTVTVCDRAHEELTNHNDWLHWSITDPVMEGTRGAFDRTVDELRTRIREVTAA